jgi:tetratricopeptide (TPR) repeat protein
MHQAHWVIRLTLPGIIGGVILTLLGSCNAPENQQSTDGSFTAAEIEASRRLDAAWRTENSEKQAELLRQAVTLYTQALHEQPANAVTYYNNRGLAYFHLSEHEPALADFTAGLALAPAAAHLRLNRARVYEQQGALPEALADYEAYMQRTASDTSAITQQRRAETAARIAELRADQNLSDE